jgi:hypothetical protein
MFLKGEPRYIERLLQEPTLKRYLFTMPPEE